jgi:hypothetical protein
VRLVLFELEWLSFLGAARAYGERDDFHLATNLFLFSLWKRSSL